MQKKAVERREEERAEHAGARSPARAPAGKVTRAESAAPGGRGARSATPSQAQANDTKPARAAQTDELGLEDWDAASMLDAMGLAQLDEAAEAEEPAAGHGGAAEPDVAAPGRAGAAASPVQQRRLTTATGTGWTGAVQRKAHGDRGADTPSIHQLADHGTSGNAGALPHLDAIQHAFGPAHDLSHVRSYTDGAATEAATGMGAVAYARGNQIAFAGEPSLHTAAHEAAHVVQQRAGVHLKNGVGEVGDAYERHADEVADRVVQGRSAEDLLPATSGASASAGGAVQHKTKVNPTPTARHNKLALVGDGTPANPGLTVADLDAYVARQADWFAEPSLSQADRDLVWKVLLLLKEGSHMGVALAALRIVAVAGLPAGDLTKLKKYAACFNASAQTVQLTAAAPTMARALQVGQAVIDLEAFVPTAVLRVVIPESGLNFLLGPGKLAELKKYYQTFKPTLETQAEWPHVEALLTETVGKYAALAPWIHDLHIFTKPTRAQLLANIADKSRARPVLLVLFSATDWNTAFLQATNVQGAIMNPKNLALVVQGMPSIAAATAEVNRVADDYGQRTKSFDWSTWSIKYSPGRLGQVVIAGHGSDQSVEMASPGTNPTAAGDNRHVSYDEAPIDSSNPKANGTELLIDTVLTRMDPKDANVVFAGCLVGSHDIPAGTNVGNAATAQANLQAALAAHPNLADYVRQRMAAKGITGTVQAANGSTTFDSFNVDASGRAKLSNPGDPDISGSKLQYVRTGIEPEGALRAALECYADPAIGPAKVTSEIRTRVAGLAASTYWWECITRVGFELCLPAAPADVDVAKLLDLSHRISAWFFGGWQTMINVQSMANNVKAAEAPKVFATMLATSWGTQDHLAVGAREAWMQHDAAQAGPFMTALTGSSLKRETFKPLLARGIVDPKLATLLPVGGAPTKGQLILALTIAANDGAAMPADVRAFLRAAAGGAQTSSFPAGLGVGPILAPTGELEILEAIGLAPTSPPPPPSSGGGTVTVDGNVDTNSDKKNETYIPVSPHEATVDAAVLNVRRQPNASAPIRATVTKGTVVRVMGETATGWSLVDHQGKIGFVSSKYLVP